jgi:hypothetical protein
MFHPLSDPIALIHTADMHVFHSDSPAVRLLESFHHHEQRDLAWHGGQILEKSLVVSCPRGGLVSSAVVTELMRRRRDSILVGGLDDGKAVITWR